MLLRRGVDTPFQAFEREPGTFAIVLVALPNFRDESRLGCELVHQSKELDPIDFTIVDLQAFSINALRICQV